MSEPQGTRQPPEIIIMEDSPQWCAQDFGMTRTMARVGFVFGSAIALGLLCYAIVRVSALWVSNGAESALTFAVLVFCGMLVVLLLAAYYYNKRTGLAMKWEQLLHALAHADAEQIQDPGSEFWSCWKDTMFSSWMVLPAPQETLVEPKCARVICLGKFVAETDDGPPRQSRWRQWFWQLQHPCADRPASMPIASDWRFHPEIISAADIHRKQRMASLLGLLLLVGLMVAQRFGYFAGPSFPMVLQLAFHFLVTSGLSFIVAAWALWFWKGSLRPTYMRLAPGMIQVLEYAWFWQPEPARIRSYPIEAGTLAVVVHRGDSTVLTLARGEQRDSLSLSELRNSPEVTRLVWQAVLSTAPTPPLCESALVG